MQIDLTAEQKKLRDDLRTYMDKLLTPALEKELETSEGGGPEYTKAMHQMGRDGWLGIGWDKEYGGQQRPAIEQFIFFDEVQRAGFPIPILTLNTANSCGLWFRGAKRVLSSENSGRGYSLFNRLYRAGCGHRSGLS